MKMELELKLQKLLREQEIKWLQMSKEKDLLEGDNNTKYFQLKASARRKRKSFFSLNQDKGVIGGDEQLRSYITSYFWCPSGYKYLNEFRRCGTDLLIRKTFLN